MTRRESSEARNRPSSSSWETGRTSGASYRELFPIGGGGFATITVALSRGTGGVSKLVVLKALRKELLSDPAPLKMFLDEARLSARMNHPNIPQVYELFHWGGTPVIVMEYVDGQPLSMIMARSRASSTKRLRYGISILQKILDALHYAHTLCDFSGAPLGLIHRDVTPQNIMVTYDGQVKLVDFGVAKVASSDCTQKGMINGKLAYMAPEQLLGEVDRRADVFSVGVILWELLAGQRFWGDAPEATMMHRLRAGDLPNVNEPIGDDPEFDRICRRALAPQREDRYATAAELRDDLERFVAQREMTVGQAALGQFVSDVCSDSKNKVQTAIRSQISHIDLSSTDEDEGADGEGAPLSPPPTPVECARRLGSNGLIFAGAGAMAAFVLFMGFGYANLDGPGSAAPLEQTLVGPRVPARVRLRTSTQPAGAIWYLDDRLLGADPVHTTLPKDGALHALRAEADGHASFTRTLRFEADIDITAVLAPAPALPNAKAPPAARAKMGRATLPAPARSASPADSREGTAAPRPVPPTPP